MTHSLKTTDLTVRYDMGKGRPPVIGALNINFDLGRKEILAVVGESGSGKTTVMKAISGLLSYKGRVEIDGVDVASLATPALRRRWLGQRIGLVFQDAAASLVPHMSVLDQVLVPMRIYGKSGGGQRARDLLDLVRIPATAAHRSINEISGGQRQRIAIARSLALEPSLLIADEPTASLDTSVRAQIITLLDDLRHQQNLSIVIISHDLASIEYLADRVAVMYKGSVVETASPAQFFLGRRHPYTRDLWNAAPRISHRADRFQLAGVAREGSGFGCPYDARCDRWQAVCGGSIPPMTGASGHDLRCFNPVPEGAQP